MIHVWEGATHALTPECLSLGSINLLEYIGCFKHLQWMSMTFFRRFQHLWFCGMSVHMCPSTWNMVLWERVVIAFLPVPTCALVSFCVCAGRGPISWESSRWSCTVELRDGSLGSASLQSQRQDCTAFVRPLDHFVCICFYVYVDHSFSSWPWNP